MRAREGGLAREMEGREGTSSFGTTITDAVDHQSFRERYPVEPESEESR